MGRKLIVTLMISVFIIGLIFGLVFAPPKTKIKYIAPEIPFAFPQCRKTLSMEGFASTEDDSTIKESYWVEVETFTLFLELAKEYRKQGFDISIHYSVNIYGKYYFWFKLNPDTSSIRWTMP